MTDVPYDKGEILAQIEALSKLAAGSNDPALTAKALAFADPRVQEIFFSKLAAGHRFVSQRAFPDGGPGMISVFFEFFPAPDKIAIVGPSFLAAVSLTERKVVRVADPAIPSLSGGAHEAGALPFTIAVPSNAPQVVTTETDVIDLRNREAFFFEALPQPQGGAPEPQAVIPGPGPVPVPNPPPRNPSYSTTVYSSPYDTAIASSSTSGGVADDSTTDWRTDASNDLMMDRSD